MAQDDVTVADASAEQVPRGQLRWLWATLAVIALDQFTKYLVKTHIGLHDSIELLPVFSLTHWLNPGAAFNFLAGQAGWQRWFFALLAAAVSVALIVWLRRLPRAAQITGAALALILGGALGNLIDRVSSGLVVDFLLVHWHEHYFPAFNVADSAITVGAALLLLDAYVGQKTGGQMGSTAKS